MNIHREGYKIIGYLASILLIICVLIGLIWPEIGLVHYLLYASAFIFLLFVIAFFRNPQRDTIKNDHIIYSGADGKIVVIEEVIEKEFFNEKRLQVSIYMSSRNVHVNRFPIGGKVLYHHHHAGSFLLAFHPKSSTHNERNTVVVDNKLAGKVLFRQIAGMVARRIVCNADVGNMVIQGEEMGMIRFGSRFDIFLPISSRVDVKLGQKVKAGITPIAYIE